MIAFVLLLWLWCGLQVACVAYWPPEGAQGGCDGVEGDLLDRLHASGGLFV